MTEQRAEQPITPDHDPSIPSPNGRGSERWLYKGIYIGAALFGALSLGLIISGLASDPISGIEVIVGTFILLGSFGMACSAKMSEDLGSTSKIR